VKIDKNALRRSGEYIDELAPPLDLLIGPAHAAGLGVDAYERGHASSRIVNNEQLVKTVTG